jgi:hypothetical protein
MSSNVVLTGMMSNDIQIKRSVRQGSVLGPWLYMVYIHDLAVALQSSDFGCKLGQVSCGEVLRADDISVMALTPYALQELLNICEAYSTKWRYRYNPIKSKVIVFGQHQRSKQCLQLLRNLKLYGNSIDEVTECMHVGITLNGHQNNTYLLQNCASKLRGGLMAIVGSGAEGLSCCSAVKLYKTIVLPRGLYGAELWSNISRTNLDIAERAHRFCLKFIQHLPKRTKTIIVQSMINMYGLETYIDKKKNYSFLEDCVSYLVQSLLSRYLLNGFTNI